MKTKVNMTPEKRRNTILSLLLIVAILGACAFLDANKYSYNYAISIIERSMIYAVVAVSMNLVNGFTGLFSLGQAGFMALGAYVTAILTIPVDQRASVYYISGIHPAIANLHAPILVALILGGLVAAAFAALIGIPVLRLKSDYLAIATLGFAEIIRALISAPQLDTITNGSYGLKSIPGFSSLFQVLALTVVCIGLMVLLINSSFGRMFKAVREDEIAAEAMGINLARHKQLSFCVSSFFAGVGGAMLAMYTNTIQAKTFTSAMTYEILLIVVIGGIGSISGSVIGTFLYVACAEWWLFGLDNGRFLFIKAPGVFRSGFRMVVFSVIIMIVVLFFRKGIMGDQELPQKLRGLRARLGKKKEAAK